LDSIEIGIYLIVVILRVVKGNNLFIYGMVMLYGNIFGYYMRYPASALSTTSFPSIQMCFVILSFIGILLPGSNKLRTKKSSLNEILALNTSK
jgi:disulfide bond formation protein DsbB